MSEAFDKNEEEEIVQEKKKRNGTFFSYDII